MAGQANTAGQRSGGQARSQLAPSTPWLTPQPKPCVASAQPTGSGLGLLPRSSEASILVERHTQLSEPAAHLRVLNELDLAFRKVAVVGLEPRPELGILPEDALGLLLDRVALRIGGHQRDL